MKLAGLFNHFETEAIPGVLPKNQNSPQRVERGLYAEQLSGSSFTTPRHLNLKSWLYRLRPSTLHSTQKSLEIPSFRSAPDSEGVVHPEQFRWSAPPRPSAPVSWIESLTTLATAGDVSLGRGCATHQFFASTWSKTEFFSNADGEMLFAPDLGRLRLVTELGTLEIEPGHIGVVPRGMKFRVELLDDGCRAYVIENYGAPMRLPELGPIGANGLANPRHFFSPGAAFEDVETDCTITTKLGGKFWTCTQRHSPLDVVAWQGNYAPYQYDLFLFNTIGTVSFDHPDPSIFTVLTSPSDMPGVANLDFVIFPPRWMVGENTFRPPYYHRNVMSEFMGLLKGVYDAKPDGFAPGGSSLHNCMSGHGPDAATFEKASSAPLKPEKLSDTMAFMAETRYPFSVTREALGSPLRQRDYLACWSGLKKQFR
jgi:homogentisate 1,2-dioxygenase